MISVWRSHSIDSINLYWTLKINSFLMLYWIPILRHIAKNWNLSPEYEKATFRCLWRQFFRLDLILFKHTEDPIVVHAIYLFEVLLEMKFPLLYQQFSNGFDCYRSQKAFKIKKWPTNAPFQINVMLACSMNDRHLTNGYWIHSRKMLITKKGDIIEF